MITATVSLKIDGSDETFSALPDKLNSLGAYDVSVRVPQKAPYRALELFVPFDQETARKTEDGDLYAQAADSIFRNPKADSKSDNPERHVSKAPELGMGYEPSPADLALALTRPVFSNLADPAPINLRLIGERTALVHEICDAVADLIDASGGRLGSGVETGMRAAVTDILSKYSIISAELLSQAFAGTPRAAPLSKSINP